MICIELVNEMAEKIQISSFFVPFYERFVVYFMLHNLIWG